MKRTNEILFSYFNPPVSCATPAKSVSLEEVNRVIVSDALKGVTEKIRRNKAEKANVLPSVTFSGTFSSRSKKGLQEYSTLIVFDVDKLDFASTLKWRLSIDVFLKVVLAFISPSGEGLKFVVRVKGGIPEEHELYFRAVARYVKDVFGIEIDESGKDISRLCFLCHDPAVYYNPGGCVGREALLRLLPNGETKSAIGGRDVACNVSTNNVSANKTNTNPESDEICEKLNKLPGVLLRAFFALRKAGWKQLINPERWSRPNGEPGKNSAVFNYYKAESRWVFTNFSDNGQPFKTKGYSPLGVICELEFGGDFEACVNTLKAQYLQ